MGATLNDMQDALLGRLREIFPAPAYQVEDWPDQPESYRLAHANAAILLVFADRVFQPPQATDGTIQPNEPNFQIAYLTRSLRGAGDRAGAYALLEQGRQGLKGFQLSNGNLWIQREFFRTRAPGGVWIFGQNWKTTDVFD